MVGSVPVEHPVSGLHLLVARRQNLDCGRPRLSDYVETDRGFLLPISGGIGSSQKGNLRFPGQPVALWAGAALDGSTLPATASSLTKHLR